MSSAPKVFVSHASEDKERFVIPFAAALRARGIDAWIDRWEMLPGDSLVDKIFEEGLKEAAAVIVVLSNTSVRKPWVREELNSAIVTRIQKGTKIIPIVLEGCDVPEALKSLLWESVKDVSDFGDCLARVVDAIFGHTSKPPLGAAPAYVSTPMMSSVGGLSHADNFVLKTLYDEFVARGRDYVSPDRIVAAAMTHGMDESVVSESLEVLAHQGYVELLKHIGRGPYPSRIRQYGTSVMLGREEQALVRQVGLCLTNDGLTSAEAISAATGLPQSLVHHAFDCLESRGHIKVARSLGGVAVVVNMNPVLRRTLAS
ncbi:TIR domain-containing protein [Ralstonia insidiosa]|uniref:TIR domain-containing protein n=1 Tax=Ralstonia insidiosa TaxID=190721 RepID=UPI000CEE3EB4|nr:TIR domain-containing protein [Ralstonia insidiosa]